MKKIIASIFSCYAATGALSAGEYSADQVKAECTQKWGVQFDMVKYCIDKRQDGLRTYTNLKIAADVSEELSQAMVFCEHKWQQQWDMVSYCAQKQIDGAIDLVEMLAPIPSPEKGQIMAHCYQKWAPQHDMAAYCAKKQIQALKALN